MPFTRIILGSFLGTQGDESEFVQPIPQGQTDKVYQIEAEPQGELGTNEIEYDTSDGIEHIRDDLVDQQCEVIVAANLAEDKIFADDDVDQVRQSCRTGNCNKQMLIVKNARGSNDPRLCGKETDKQSNGQIEQALVDSNSVLNGMEMGRLVVVDVNGVDQNGRNMNALFSGIVKHIHLVIVVVFFHLEHPLYVGTVEASQAGLIIGKVSLGQ